MNVRFILSSPHAEKSPVRVVVTQRGKVYRRATGVTVRSKGWNGKRQVPEERAAAARLRDIRLELTARLDDLATGEEVTAALDAVFGAVETRKPAGMWEWLEGWALRPCQSMRYRRLAVRVAKDLMSGDGDSFADIDAAWARRLGERMDAAGYSMNYKASVTARLRTGLKAAYDEGAAENAVHGCLKMKWRTADSTYLTAAEVETLWAAELKGRDADARDLFCVGIYTAARFQSYSELTEANTHDGLIEFVQPKTGGRVFVPLSPRVAEVMARHGGRVPKMSQQELNRRMKEICRGLGFDTAVDVTLNEGGHTVITRKRKWEMVSSHTARRTGATLLYLSGVPTRQCMMITGHTTEENFRKYIRITAEENARMLADNPFFRPSD